LQLELVDPHSSDAERVWRDLEAASRPSYFLSWAWVATWLACLPRHVVPQLAVIIVGGAPIAACFLAKRLVMHRRVVPSRAVFLNTTGVKKFDRLWIEYNGLVGHDVALRDLLRMVPGRWDELHLPGLHERALGDVTSVADVQIDRRVPSFFVDLDKARARGYLALLSGQTRSQVRRAQREAGDVRVEIAGDLSHAMDIYSELVTLHTAQWRARGKPGAFADPWFDRFHRMLITDRFAHGEIQLVRVRNASGPIGCLYNFTHAGRVLQYQSGMSLFENDKLKPGFVCHAAAIEHAATSGLALYDFLGGDARYKKSLSTDHTWLIWARVQRRRIRFFVADRIRRLRDLRRA
jgi:CelD/BcsL family acetyltransferase involved in cellulose biosynthesis